MALLLLFLLLIPTPLLADSVTTQVQGTVDKVIAILKDPQLKSDTKRRERRELLRQAIYPRFDFTEMAKRSLGPHWRRLNAEEQREFVVVFTELVESSYVAQVESYDDDKLYYTRETLDKNYSEVNTKIATKNGEEVAINYRLHLVEDKWKIYDIVIENISLVNNYRSQFHRVITNSSYQDLLSRLKQKQSQLGGQKRTTDRS